MADLGKKVGLGRRRLFGLAPCLNEFLLHFLPSGDVAKHNGALVGPVAGQSDGHEQRNQRAVAGPADHLASAVEHSRTALAGQTVETIVSRLHTLRRKQFGECTVDEFMRLVAEQRPGAAVGGHDEAVGIKEDDAIAGGVEKGGELGEFGLRRLELCRSAVGGKRRPGVDGACRRNSVLCNRRRDFCLIGGFDARQALGQLAREFAKGVAFDGAQRGGMRLRDAGKMQDVFSRRRDRRVGGCEVSLASLVAIPGSVLNDRIRRLALLRQGIELCDFTTDAKPPVAVESPVSIEHR